MRASYDGNSIIPFSWWSWRPGIQPLHALLLGGVAMLPGLAIASLGFFTLASNGHNVIVALMLVAVGMVMLCYPLLLARWGLRDLLITRYAPQRLCQLTTYVIATREVEGTARRDRPGMMPRGTHAWHGIAVLLPEDVNSRRVLTFSVNASLFSAVHEGAQVSIVYSPHVHYVYTLEIVHEQA
jgi:hypothetical protein